MRINGRNLKEGNNFPFSPSRQTDETVTDEVVLLVNSSNRNVGV